MPLQANERYPTDRQMALEVGSRLGHYVENLGGEPEVAEHPSDHGRLIDECDQAHPSAAPRAGEDVEAETPPHQVRPEIARGGA